MTDDTVVEKPAEGNIDGEGAGAFIIGANSVENKAPKRKRAPKKVEIPDTDICLYSPGNIHAGGSLGDISKGYSIHPAARAEKWLAASRKIRKATPEEVAEFYGV